MALLMSMIERKASQLMGSFLGDHRAWGFGLRVPYVFHDLHYNTKNTHMNDILSRLNIILPIFAL